MKKDKKKFRDRFAIILRYLSLYKKYLWFGLIAVIGANTFILVNPYLMKIAFDRLEQKAPPSDILNIALLVVVFSIVSGLFRFAMRRTIIWMSRKVEFRLRSDLFKHLLKLNPTFYHNNRTGDIMARSTNDIEAVRMMVGPGIMHIGNTIVSTITAICFMLYLSPELTLYSLLPLPVLSLVVNRLGTVVHKRYSKIQEYFAVLTSKVQENLAGVRVLRAYGQEEAENDDFSRHNKKYIGLNMSLIRIYALLYPILFMLAGAVNLSVLYFGGKAVIGGDISLGTLVAFFAYLSMLIWPMVALGWVVSLYQRGTASLDRINRILDSEPAVKSNGPDAAQAEIKGRIEFRNLDFGYNGEQVLHNISLIIEPGQTIGIVGPTASGKSTLVSLIGRLYPLPRGKLFIDEIDINDWELTLLRRQIGFVPQEPFLFSDTIQNNILFGVDAEKQSEAIRAATTAVVEKEIERFPHGYDTILGERGITLSGGQKQRLSIARALVTDPKILILDDATSSVDTETEHLINSRMQEELSRRTSIIISHRASAVKDADLIVYMRDGAIVEQGSHESLIQNKRFYAELYRMQLIEEELGKM